jgi:hypothetical protein
VFHRRATDQHLDLLGISFWSNFRTEKSLERRTWAQRFGSCSRGILYRRLDNPKSIESFNYQPAFADGFDEVAWRFFCRER